ncbi:myogenesis-regulating glycosidase isoform X2 [Arctopsyche grandis]
MPPKLPRSHDDDSFTGNNSDDEDSPINSITSINSLASLLKEKLQSIPSKIKKKPSDYKIRAFVGFLFLCIVFFVGFAYIMYHQQVLARSYFHRIKFNQENRMIKIFNSQNIEILRGHLGSFFGTSEAYDCVGSDEKYDGSICLQWLNGARLYINKEFSYTDEPEVKCYSIRWQALREGVNPTDCFDWSSSTDHWFGGGQFENVTWPLERGTHGFAPFITGDIKKHQWGNALMKYFINSRGSAIIVDNDTPLYVSINNENSRKFCLQAKHDSFGYINHITTYPELNYNICTAINVKLLHSSLSRQSLWDGLKPEDKKTIHSLLSEPVWHISPRWKHELTESMMYNYTEDVIALGFLKQGHVLINEYWQNHTGDFTLDESRFQTLEDKVNIIHRRGFKIVFSIQPFMSTESINFAECVQKRLLISERFSNRTIPALTRYKALPSAGMLDITNNRTVTWLHTKLQKIVNTYKIDAFFLDLGTAYDVPRYYQCERPLINPDEYKTIFVERFEKLISLIGVSSAVSLPRPPIFVSLPPFESSWEAIKNVIPTILSYGVVGYPFLIPGAVGGDIDWPGGDQFVPGSPKISLEQNTTQENDKVLPDKELYLRWLQLATFLPVIKFTHLPSKYNDEQVLEAAKILTSLRQKTVTPLLIKYSSQALDEGLPLIRPLWMLEPNDPAGLVIDDEFSVGEELIVAPILEKGSVFREVYLPPGVWKDGIDESLRKGSRWMHDYRVPLDKVAYFIKMPDNTRF